MTPAAKLIRELVAASINSYRAVNEPVRFGAAKAQREERKAVRELFIALSHSIPTEAEIDEIIDL